MVKKIIQLLKQLIRKENNNDSSIYCTNNDGNCSGDELTQHEHYFANEVRVYSPRHPADPVPSNQRTRNQRFRQGRYSD